MSSDFAVSIKNISKVYPIFSRPIDRLKQLLVGSRKKYYKEFTALNNVSFDVEKGITFGLLGQNGSGKSTLLQIIAGILQSTSGEVVTQGKVAALLELGAGFNPEFTGRENVYINAALLGFEESKIPQIFPSIEAFADIGEFIDRPVKTYSSGMFARLAFSVASAVSPDILIVDEILSVGDAKFQARCFKRLEELQKSGTTIILVTHAVEQVVMHCSKAAVLNNGKLFFIGAPREAANKYLDLLFGNHNGGKELSRDSYQKTYSTSKDGHTFEVALDSDVGLERKFESRPYYNKYEHRWGDRSAEILDVRFYTDGNETFRPLHCNDTIKIAAKIHFKTDIIRPIFGFSLKTKEGVSVFGSNSEMQSNPGLLSDALAGSVIEVSFEVDLKLIPGDYFISIGVASVLGGEVVPHDRRYDSIYFNVVDTPNFSGLTSFPIKIDRKLLGMASTSR